MKVKNIHITTDSISHNNESGGGADLSTIRSKQKSGLWLQFRGYL